MTQSWRYSAHWQAHPLAQHENQIIITLHSIGDNQYWSCFLYDITSFTSACLMFYPGTFREKVSVSHGLFSIFWDFGLRLASLQESKVSCIGNLPPTPLLSSIYLHLVNTDRFFFIWLAALGWTPCLLSDYSVYPIMDMFHVWFM